MEMVSSYFHLMRSKLFNISLSIGQCIYDSTDRHLGVRYSGFLFCQNLRDVNYMCEAVKRDSKSWWTIDNGYCLPYSLAYQTLGLDSTAATDECAFSSKCALSNGLDQNCKCKNAIACRSVVNSLCAKPNLYYPAAGPVISPYTYMRYIVDRDWTNKEPDRIVYQGRVKCIGYQVITISTRIFKLNDPFAFYRYRISENRLCSMEEEIYGIRNYTGPHYDVNCWNSSKTFNNHSYQVSFLCGTRCISKYRIRDSIRDCHQNDEAKTINSSCLRIQRHRLQCSASDLSCLLVGALGNWDTSCTNSRDEYDEENDNVPLRYIVCEKNTDTGCTSFRHYIQTSSMNNANRITIANNSILNDHSTTIISFRSYCNSIFDIKSTVDEISEFCEKWICLTDEYQCLSGQCISQSWVCDGKLILFIVSIVKFIFLSLFAGEWDCNDGSDEQRIFVMDHLSEHNSKLKNLSDIKEQCHQHYHLNNTPFSDICDISFEYPCFRTGIVDPFNIELHRPCINLTQIGDGKIDCLTGLDERNRLQCTGRGMLGFHFQLNATHCVTYSNLCTDNYPWIPGANIAYDTVCFYQRKGFKNDTDDDCKDQNDVICLNDVCLKNARCNGQTECSHGEDEYRCLLQNQSPLDYRGIVIEKFIPLRLPNYPLSTQLLQQNHLYAHNDTDPGLRLITDERMNLLGLIIKLESVDNVTKVFAARNSKNKSVYEIVRDALSTGTITFENHYLPFICNRGLAVKYYTHETVCLCPPSFYGSQCEFYSDRITVATHLHLTSYRASFHQTAIVKVLTTFLFEDQIIDYYEFHVDPQTQTDKNYLKQIIYFLYPRQQDFLEMKKNNRSGTQLYSVRFEAFHLHLNEAIQSIGVWQYPIYFDFLPAFRLSKILHFHPQGRSFPYDPCSNNSCGKNGICQDVINSKRLSYFCSCRSGYHGVHCEYYDEECNNYCAPKSICKPKHRGILTSDQSPLCLCPASTFGSTCYFKNDSSQISKGMVNVTFMLSSNSALQTADITAVTISYNDYDIPSLRFIMRHQQVYDELPSHLELIYSHKHLSYAPTTAVLKVYETNYKKQEPEYYVLYFYSHQKEINITVDLTSENHCPLVQTLWHLLQTQEKSGKLEYFSSDRRCEGKRLIHILS